MGAEGFLIASALNAILAQRLIRRICSNCTAPAELTIQQSVWLKVNLTAHGGDGAVGVDANTVFHSGTGCTYCNMTGYNGRIGIYELLEMDAPLADAIRRNDLPQFAALAKAQEGFIPLVQRALGYAAAQVTSIEEVMRVTSGLEERDSGSRLLEDLDSETRLRESG
jgi:MSHA biogenesis protein MshE